MLAAFKRLIWKSRGCSNRLLPRSSAALLLILLVVSLSWGANAAETYFDVDALKAKAEQGDARALWNLGAIYENGQGVKQDYAEAMKWWRKLAEQGNSSAEDAIGRLYELGKGVNQDYAEAAKWYRKAADHGNALAQTTLGYSYENGHGVKQDYAEAAKWFRKAADHSDDLAQQALGDLYRTGKGLTQNYEEAYFWYSLAAQRGRPEPITARDSVTQHLSSAQKAVIDKRVAGWEWPASSAVVVTHSSSGK